MQTNVYTQQLMAELVYHDRLREAQERRLVLEAIRNLRTRPSFTLLIRPLVRLRLALLGQA